MGRMRKLCARCKYWCPPVGKPILCEVEGLCLYRPPGDDAEHKVECLTEACGCCEFFEPNPDLDDFQDDTY